jgi:hypothetical protein
VLRSARSRDGELFLLGKLRATSVVIALVAALHAGTAEADSNLFVGVGEDHLMGRPAETIAVARDLGVKAFRLSLIWQPGQTQIDSATRAGLDNAVVAAGGARIVTAVYGDRGAAPLTPQTREEYCSYVRSVLEHYPQINDVVIWNEPNLTFYWRPQFNADGTSAAPAAYEALLARCWDVLHAYRPGVNVIGPVVSLWGNDNPDAVSNVSHSPLGFIAALGDAYRASGRTQPILDTFGHHPHPPNADERPWKRHDSVYVSLGDWGKLMTALAGAFEGTAQPIPGQGPPIWWLEVGYQTLIDAPKSHLYWRQETWRRPIPAFVGGEPDFPPPHEDSPAPDQATQLIDSVRLSYCQPYVEAFFNFLLWDESDLSGWQSGVLWLDGQRKGSYDGFKRAIAEVNERRVDCSRMKGGGPFISPSPGAGGRRPTVPPKSAPIGRGSGGGAGMWDEWGPLGPLERPSARADSLPSGFFAQAELSTLHYTGTVEGPFGFVKLRGRLTSEGRPVASKRISIVAGGETYSGITDADGVVAMKSSAPLPIGTWNVRLSFPGDPEVRPAVAAANVEVVNTAGKVESGNDLLAGKRYSGRFRISSDGTRVKGRVHFRARGLNLRARRVTALGVGKGGRAAWFSGFNRSGKRFLAYAEDHGRAAKPDRFRLWIDDGPRIAAGRLRSGDVKITTRSGR